MNSDTDVLTSLDLYPVIEQLPSDYKEFTSCMLLMITDPDTAAGYVKLQLVIHGIPITNKECGHVPLDKTPPTQEDQYGRQVFKHFNHFPDTNRGTINKNGPAHTYDAILTRSTLDVVEAFRCKSWPSVATEWVERVRRYGWPQQSVIKRFTTLGCFVVGVGYPDSREGNLEWRLSFSLQERELMFGLNDVQHKCYVLLKLIKTDLITPAIGKSISSYHCKTCLFYMIESNPLDIWKPENLFICVKKCLELLLDWTKRENCPNYFIPTENMFDHRIKGCVRHKVIQIINEVLLEGFGFLTRIKSDKINRYLQNREHYSLFETLSEQSRIEIYSKYLGMVSTSIRFALDELRRSCYPSWRGNSGRYIIQKPEDIIDQIKFVYKIITSISNLSAITEHTTEDTRNVVNVVLPFFHTCLGSHLASLAMISDDLVLQTKYIGEPIQHYRHGMSSDLTSGRLKYCTYLYFDGQYSECEKQLMSLEKQYRPDATYIPKRLVDFRFVISQLPILAFSGFNIRNFLYSCVNVSVFFLPTEYPLIPKALQFEMFRSFGTPQISRCNYWYNWVVVDSRVYLYFLWYLLAVNMNKPKLDRFLLLFKLILCTYDVQIFHRETAFNLISWVCVQEGFIPKALEFLIASWFEVGARDMYYRECPEKEFILHHNAAKWHMLLLLKRVWEKQVHPSHGNKVRENFCFHCLQQKSDKSKQCDRCRIAQYCSQSCKINNEEIHEKICQLLR